MQKLLESSDGKRQQKRRHQKLREAQNDQETQAVKHMVKYDNLNCKTEELRAKLSIDKALKGKNDVRALEGEVKKLQPPPRAQLEQQERNIKLITGLKQPEEATLQWASEENHCGNQAG